MLFTTIWLLIGFTDAMLCLRYFKKTDHFVADPGSFVVGSVMWGPIGMIMSLIQFDIKLYLGIKKKNNVDTDKMTC